MTIMGIYKFKFYLHFYFFNNFFQFINVKDLIYNKKYMIKYSSNSCKP